MAHTYYVYILASRPFGAIYVGVTNDLVYRVQQHREGNVSGHTSKYKIKRLVHYETFEDVNEAIHYEKRIKKWRRAWKDALIEKTNPNWHDLYDDVRGGSWRVESAWPQ